MKLVVDNPSLTEAQHDSLVGLAAMDLLTAEPPWSIETIAVVFRLSVKELQARLDIALASQRSNQRTI